MPETSIFLHITDKFFSGDRRDRCMSIRLLRFPVIRAVSGETDEREMEIRRCVEEVRSRLERDLGVLIQDLETIKNARIKQLNKTGSELQTVAAKLDGLRQQLQWLAASGTAVDVVAECARKMSPTPVDRQLSPVPEPSHFVLPGFTRSDLLQQPDNLVGQLTAAIEIRKFLLLLFTIS